MYLLSSSVTRDLFYMNFHRLALITTVVAFIVIILGAYTRLSDAGLGCPDWPGCYGQLDVPDTEQELNQAMESFPNSPVEQSKAWKEMVHRYFAGTLGLMILFLCLLAWRHRKRPEQPLFLPTVLVGIVIFQALLGMWTVTLMLKPLVVVVHLLFGFLTLAILFWLTLRTSKSSFLTGHPGDRRFRFPAVLGMLILVVQIALGGWTSSNYAALACPDLPVCQASWIPDMNFEEAFVLWREIGVNYEGGRLDLQARTAIHWTHRVGAVMTFAYLLLLGLVIWLKGTGSGTARTALLVIFVVTAQFSLGLSNVFFSLPLPVAVAHNAVAALLLLVLVMLNFILWFRLK